MAETTQEEYFAYLVKLRNSGHTNMWGASTYLVKKFRISHSEATDILLKWIASFK